MHHLNKKGEKHMSVHAAELFTLETFSVNSPIFILSLRWSALLDELHNQKVQNIYQLTGEDEYFSGQELVLALRLKVDPLGSAPLWHHRWWCLWWMDCKILLEYQWIYVLWRFCLFWKMSKYVKGLLVLLIRTWNLNVSRGIVELMTHSLMI